MGIDLKYRKLDTGDIGDIANLFAELTGDPLTADWGQIKKVLSFEATHMFGAELNGSIVSMATLHLLPNLGGG
jgi:hypothetical protein